MTNFLVRHFIKDYEEVEKVSVRTAYGIMASIVGILCNVLLFGVKLTVGMILHSISVMADGFNNLSDAGSSVISFIGVKMASKPADEDHPFGHGRMEYIAALIVSFLVLQVGFSFFKDAIVKIREPQNLKFSIISIGILLLSIGVKLWLGLFNRKLGEKINSQVMMAVFADSVGDVIATAATILSIAVFGMTGINIDGFVGLGVAVVVMWAGIGIAKDTLEPLLGEATSAEDYEKLKNFVEQYDGVVGTHDMIVHNYGPGRSMASIHAEVPNNVDIETSHEVIDRIEREAKNQLGIFLVVHMDPIEMSDEQVLKIRQQAEEVLKQLDLHASLHDLRVVDGKDQINIIFDMIVPRDYTREQKRELNLKMNQRMKEIDARYALVITIEHSYIAEEEK
ncbi:MAG: cation diffusion facilitator family transporter [Hespellia sp.]|nr:cation diffusion facilitator family transporter [Hespellia sp.]